ncbi:MAG: hypothetical protein ACRDVK_05745 [Acidimicrobiia bacterium]
MLGIAVRYTDGRRVRRDRGGELLEGTAATYKFYWRLAVDRLGDRPVDQVGVDDCEAIVAAAVARARGNRPGTDGRSARENCIGALRALFARAERAGLVARRPAAGLEKPRRLPNRRRALEDDELREVIDAARTTSQDPDHDLAAFRGCWIRGNQPVNRLFRRPSKPGQRSRRTGRFR